MSNDNIDIEKLTDDQFREYLLSRGDEKVRLSRLSVDELEKEFDLKSDCLLFDDHYEFSDLYLREFIEVVFERNVLNAAGVSVPFEEIQSYEYQVWLKQYIRNKRLEKDLKKESGSEATGSPLLSSLLPKIDYSAYRMWRYNPIVFCKENNKSFHRLLLKDDEETLMFLENRQFAIISPVTYVGKTNSYKNARYLYAFVIDLDGVSVNEVRMLLRGMTTGVYPVANIIVNSGHGVHVYYLLERPLEMFETRLKALNKLKAGLTKIVWLVSKLGNPQIQSVVQGFRVPGTLTKFGKPIRAFWNKEAPLHTPEELNRFLGSYKLSDDEIKTITNIYPHNPAKVTLEEAKKKWPEWYASRVIGKKRVGKKWNINRGLYDWWLRKLRDGNEVTVHHRYWCILTLVIYGVKCNIPRQEVLNDALSLVPDFDRKSETVDNPFTADDVNDAMRAYDEEYNKWPIHAIESTTGIRFKRNKRNPNRGREKHIKMMTLIRDNITHPGGTWRNGNGRKKATQETSEEAAKIKKWQETNPGCNNKSKCAKDTGLSRPTVYKWWQEY